MKPQSFVVVILAACAFISVSCNKGYAQCTNNPPTASNSTFPSSITGKLVYHSYVNYGDGSSQLWVYNFRYQTLTQISNASWGVTDPMNAVWSPDGNWLLFMSIKNNAWNIFAWPTNNSHIPYNLTNSTGATRNEDPKFSADGSRIVFKQNLAIAILTKIITNRFNLIMV
jgi:Tol biopolymer transport system component